MRALISLAIALSAVLSGAPALALSTGRLDRLLALDMEELMAQEVQISTRSARPRARAPGVVTVITAEDIRASGARDLGELLQAVPGVYVRASQFAFRPLPHMRGANANQTLLMIDGVPLKDLMWGFGIYWKGVPTSAIERVELIRGPGSALYGADAMAGVINVITRAAAGIEAGEFGLRVGSDSTQAGWVAHGARVGEFGLDLTAEVSRTAGHAPFIRADAQSLADARELTSLSHAPAAAYYGWRGEDVRLAVRQGPWRVHAEHVRRADVGIGLTGAGVLDPDTRAGDRRFGLRLVHANEAVSANWSMGAEVRMHELWYDSGEGFFERPAGYARAGRDYPLGLIHRMRAHERQWGTDWSARYHGWDGHVVHIGAGVARQTMPTYRLWANDPENPARLVEQPRPSGMEAARTLTYLYLQDLWTLSDAWELTAGVRYDHYSDFGTSLNPRLALVWQASPPLTVKLMHGRAFRAPSWQELYVESSLARPNPDLKPERSHTWDLSFESVPHRALRLGVHLFRFAQNDLIARDADDRFGNVGDHVIHGVELEAHWQARPDLRILASHAWRDHADGPYRAWAVPERETSLGADWHFLPRWHWNVQIQHYGRRVRPAGDARLPLRAQLQVDTHLRYHAHEAWEFAFSLRNLFDAARREYTGPAIAEDLPLPGRQAFLELRYRF